MILLLLTLCPSLSSAACAYLICDSFDTHYNMSAPLMAGAQYGPNNATLSLTTSAQWNATIDTSFYYSAPAAFHASAPTNGSGAGAVFTKSAPTGSGYPQIYGRAMVFFSNASGADLPKGVHSWIFQAAGNNLYYGTHNDTATNKSYASVSLNLIVGNPNIALNYHWSNTGAEAGTGTSGNKTAPLDRWFCLQWHFDGPNSGAKVWIDGSLWINVTHNTSFDQFVPNGAQNWRFPDEPGWSTLQFGYQHYQPFFNPVDMHLDDYVLDTQMTCCPCEAGVTLSYCCPPTPNNSGGSVLAVSVMFLLSALMIAVF